MYSSTRVFILQFPIVRARDLLTRVFDAFSRGNHASTAVEMRHP